MLSLTCRDATTMRLQYLHQVGAEAGSEPAALRVTAGSRSFALVRLGSAAQGEGGDKGRVENHGAELPLAALDAATLMIETTATSAPAADSPPVPLAVQGAAPAVAALARRCGSAGR
jgi:hypothetical protein